MQSDDASMNQNTSTVTYRLYEKAGEGSKHLQLKKHLTIPAGRLRQLYIKFFQLESLVQ